MTLEILRIVFDAVFESTWEALTAARTVGVPYGEVTATDNNLLEIMKRKNRRVAKTSATNEWQVFTRGR